MPVHDSRGNGPALLALSVPANRHTVLHNAPRGRAAPEDVQMFARADAVRARAAAGITHSAAITVLLSANTSSVSFMRRRCG